MQIERLPTLPVASSRPPGITILPQSSGNSMLPFLEIPVDPQLAVMARKTLESQPADYFRPYFGGLIPSSADKAAYIEEAIRRLTPARVFENNLYRVEVLNTPIFGQGFIHLNITRLDGGTCKEWRHLQQIKNEIVGAEYEGFELFPAESRLVDTANQYHLWVSREPNFRFPVGWWLRVVREPPVMQTGDPHAPG